MSRLKRLLYIYRYDIVSLTLVFTIIIWFLNPLYSSGHIVFSDLDFPLDSTRYLEEIKGLWNNKWNTTTMLNLPRLIYIYPFWLLSYLFNSDGSLFIKSFITGNLIISSLSIYILIKSIIRVYLGDKNSLPRILAISLGAIFYGINPWVIFRLQHIYLICGYSLLPLALNLFFKIFDPKFQEIIISGYTPIRIKLYRSNILHIGLLSIVISIMSAAIHYFFYGIILIIILWILLLIKQLLIYRDSNRFIKRAIITNFSLKAVLLGMFTLIFCYYWFSIYFGSILIDAQSSQHNINVVDTLSLFSKHSSIVKSLLLISYWWPMFDLGELPVTFYIGGGIILSIIVFGIVSYSFKHHILLFLVILSTLFLIISTGTTAPVISNLFVKLVMDVPFFGNLFRDPNKLLGIVAISYSVFLVFGVEKILTIKSKRENALYILKFSLFSATLIGTIIYILPLREKFIDGFYKPVNVPGDYISIQDSLLKSDYRVLNLPTSGAMVDTSTGVSTPDWNKNPNNLGYNKATADFTIYQSTKNTIFHHEGSDPAISYYFNFLQYMMDYGLTNRLDRFIQPLGVDELLYTSGYIGQTSRQKFNMDFINSQRELKLAEKSNYFNLYRLRNPIPSKGILDRVIYTSKGLQFISSLTFMDGFNFNNYGIVFNSQTKGNQLEEIREGDYLETTTIDELILSSLPDKYYTQPAKHVKNGNPFLGWSQSAIHTSDWMWHLKSQNIRPLRFDNSFLSGIALSFSSVKLDIPIHKKNYIKGNDYLNFEDFIFDGYSFTAENSDLVEIETYPLSIASNLPLVHGIISKGQNYNIWQVGKSGLIPAEPETPYQFFLTISGRGSNRMHLKARFYNEEREEIATAYILTPEDKVNFEYYEFYGEYITPKETKYVRVDILTNQRPEQKVHWWIHDFSIKELSQYSVPNTIDYTVKLDSLEPVIPYIRLFYSPQGESLKISLNGIESEIVTQKSDFSGFLWTKLEPLTPKERKVDIVIENSSGFNAVNEVVLLTQREYKQERFKAQRALDKANHFISLEAEYDFNYIGTVQTKRNYTNLSMGKGRSSFNGILETKVELPEDGYYNITLSIGGEENKGSFTLSMNSEENREDYTNISFIKAYGDIKSDALVIDEIFADDDSYFKSIVNKDINIRNIQDITLKTSPLKKGIYDLIIKLEYSGEPLTDIYNVNYFDPTSVLVPDYRPKPQLDGYSECISLYPYMINHKVEEDKLLITYDPSCSADWYISSSQYMDVEPDNEYIFYFDLLSQNLFKRHTKILYLNSYNQVIKTDYIPEVEERDKAHWNNYQFISKAPEGSVKMLFQIWGRANKKLESYAELKNLRVYNYNDLPLLDMVYISKLEKDKLFSKVNESNNSTYAFKTENSPHPIWVLNSNGKIIKSDTKVNSIKSLFFTDSKDGNSMELQLEKHYYAGFILWPIGLVLIAILYFYLRKRGTLKYSIKRFLIRLITKK